MENNEIIEKCESAIDYNQDMLDILNKELKKREDRLKIAVNRNLKVNLKIKDYVKENKQSSTVLESFETSDKEAYTKLTAIVKNLNDALSLLEYDSECKKDYVRKSK